VPGRDTGPAPGRGWLGAKVGDHDGIASTVEAPDVSGRARARYAALPDAWPLVGRADEVVLALEAVRRRGGVVLAGASGVGKTRLAREVVAAAEFAGAQAQWVAATRSAGTVALGAFAHLVPADAARADESQDRRALALDAIVRDLEHRSGRERVVVGVDDAHLLDDASATLVHLLATSGAARLVVTVRSGEPTPDPVVALWKDELALRVEVQPLSRTEVAALLGAALGGTVDGATARRLFNVTRGNALFLRELVAEGLSAGALVERTGLWSWDGPLRPGVRLRDLVAGRLGALDDDESDALELVALGEPVTEAVLGRLVPAEVVRRLERRHLVEARHAPDSDSRRIEVRLGHPLFGEVLVSDASPRRLNECRRQLVAAWEQESSLAPDEILRVANWRAAVGDHGNPAVLLAGARRAMVLGDSVTAERLGRGAHEAEPTVATALLLGDELSSLGRHDEAIKVWDEAADLPGEPVEHAEVAAAIAGVFAWRDGRPDDARRVLHDTAERLTDPRARDLLASHEALLASLGAPTATAAVAIAEAELARPPLSTTSRLRAQLAAASGWVDGGQIDRAVDATQEAVGVALREEIPGLAMYHAMTLAQALILAGRVADADALVEGGHEAALAAHADVGRGAWCFLRGVIAVFRGRPHQAVASLRESDLSLGRFDYGLRRGVLIWLALAEALRGDAATAERMLHDAQQTNRSRARLYDADFARARAWALVAAGQLTAGERAAADAAQVTADAERWTYEVLALHDRARFGGGGGAAAVVARLDELAGTVDGRLAPACAAHARALATADGPGLDAAAATFGELGFELFAAEAQAAAASAHGAAGQRARAHASTERARRLASACEGASTPLLRRLAALDRPGDLTPRERETAELAARGHTDREIAEALFVSIRTVHAHLRSAYAKLGVPGRTGLAEVLDIRPDPARRPTER
jgi:DNA-binding CsgD family transcriptional regulator/tetratricopeptide (TPR) repeat protein/type II secretory pathway predicted ATPase ExeA